MLGRSSRPGAAVCSGLDSDDVHGITKNDRLGSSSPGLVDRQGDDGPRDHEHLRMTDFIGCPVGHTQPKWCKRAVVELILDLRRSHDGSILSARAACSNPDDIAGQRYRATSLFRKAKSSFTSCWEGSAGRGLSAWISFWASAPCTVHSAGSDRRSLTAGHMVT